MSESRLFLIDEVIRRHQPIGLTQFLEYLNAKLENAGFNTIAKRTLINDLEILRIDYKAPLPSGSELKGKAIQYKYTEPFSLSSGMDTQDVETLGMVSEIAKELPEVLVFTQLKEILEKYSKSRNKFSKQPVVILDKNQQYLGLEHLPEAFNAVVKQLTLSITYLPFNYKNPMELNFFPWLIKEYNNRWFLFGGIMKEGKLDKMLLAFDRIISFSPNPFVTFESSGVQNLSELWDEIIGVSLSEKKLTEIVAKVRLPRAKYLTTKPLHTSQQIVNETPKFLYLRWKLRPNRELITSLLSYGDDLEVIYPNSLRLEMKQKIVAMFKAYQKPYFGKTKFQSEK